MMCVEVTVVPQCRVGLAPTVSLMSRLAMLRRRLESGAVGGDDRIPFAAGGDDGVHLAQDRCGDDGLGLRGGEFVVLPAGQIRVAGVIDRVGALGSPNRPPRRQAPPRSARSE